MKRKNLLLIVSAVLLLFLFTASLALAAPVGKVTLVAGRVDVLKPGKNLATPVKLGDPVDVGDIYRAKTKSNAEITFNNKNILKIAPATRVEINEYMVDEQKSSQVIKLHRGRVQAISGQDFIKKVAAFAEGNRFEVHTPNAVAGIRGSNMLVGFTQGTTVVIFIAGHGYLYNPQMPQLITPIIAGQMSFVAGEGIPSQPMKASEAFISGGGEAFIQIEPVKETMEEPPTVPTSFTVLDPVPPPLVIGTNFTGIMSFFDGGEGTFTGYLPYLGIGTMSASGAYSGSVPTTLEGWLEGTSDKGGAFSGPIAGIEGSWLTRMAAFYVEGNNLYFLTGDAPGTYDGSKFSISGSLGKSGSVGTVTLTPNPDDPTLLGALNNTRVDGTSPQFFPSGTIISDSGIQITSSSFNSTAPYLITNEGRKVAVIGNIYEGLLTTGASSNLPYLGYAYYGDFSEYALGPLFYSHDTANSRFMIDIPVLQSIGVDEVFGPFIGMYSMRYFGKYEGSNFRMAGAGTYVGTPANFFGDWGAASLYYNNSGMMENAGEDFGLFGGTTPPWSSPASFIAMGEYYLDYPDNPHYLMNSDISASAYPEVTYPAGTIEGYAGAIWKGGSPTAVGTISDGTIRALYITPDASGYVTAGIMKGTFTGSYYDISPTPMWGISGTLTPTPVSTGLELSNLDYSGNSIYGGLSGTFGGTGNITGLDDGNGQIQYFIYNDQSLPFGIFNLKFGNSGSPNSYSGKPEGNASWSAALGGNGGFDDYGDGYWLATVAGTWTDSGEITGSITKGQALTPLRLYNMEGKFTGVNSGTDGTWIGQVIGSYTGTPLAFMSEQYELGLWYTDATSGNLVGDRWTDFILGGTQSLWTASPTSPAPLTIIGKYYLDGYSQAHIWGDQIDSYNYYTEQNTTYDNGAYVGYIGGNENKGGIEGDIYAIYIGATTGTPSPAGILVGSFTGTAYKDIEMWQGQGSMYPVQLGNVSTSPEDLYESVSTKWFYGTDNLSDEPFTLNGTLMGGVDNPFVWNGKYMTLYDESAGSWGVWQSSVGGVYYGITLTEPWTASLEFIDDTRIIGQEVTGTEWSSITNKITGTTIGYGADITDTPVTWVSVGNVKGTFDPTLFAFQVGAIGVSIETNTYLSLAATEAGRAKLQQLGIPAVQVGMANFAGNNGNLYVNMNDVKFFAAQSGYKPTIWATGNVGGSYSTDPTPDAYVALNGTSSGGGTLTAGFTVKQWSGNKWLSTVTNGTGTLNGGSYTGSTQFKGAGAGTYGDGSFTGTAAGTAR